MTIFLNKLEELKKREGSYNKAAIAIGVTGSALHHLRKGTSTPSDETIIALAEILRVKPDEMLIEAATEKSHGKAHDRWVKIAKKYSSLAASIALLSVTYPFLKMGECILC